jgi:hypothetical protein
MCCQDWRRTGKETRRKKVREGGSGVLETHTSRLDQWFCSDTWYRGGGSGNRPVRPVVRQSFGAFNGRPRRVSDSTLAYLTVCSSVERRLLE